MVYMGLSMLFVSAVCGTNSRFFQAAQNSMYSSPPAEESAEDCLYQATESPEVLIGRLQAPCTAGMQGGLCRECEPQHACLWRVATKPFACLRADWDTPTDIPAQ